MSKPSFRKRVPAAIAVAALSLALVACGRVDDALDEAGRRVADGDLTLQADDGARAILTVDGDLLVDGEPVEVSNAQRRLLLAYRGELVAVTSHGLAIGRRGAALGASAAREAVADAFSGRGDAVGDRIKVQAAELKQEALLICDRLQDLKRAQDDLAASLPEFRPYAKLDQTDVDDCRRGD